MMNHIKDERHERDTERSKSFDTEFFNGMESYENSPKEEYFYQPTNNLTRNVFYQDSLRGYDPSYYHMSQYPGQYYQAQRMNFSNDRVFKRRMNSFQKELPKKKKQRRRYRVEEEDSDKLSLSNITRQKWTEEEDSKLNVAVKKFKAKNWKLISDEVGTNKTHIQCLQRWKQVLQPGLKKGSWSKDEDKKLLLLMNSLGAVGENPNERNSKFTDWKQVEKCMNGRTAKQCRERWLLNIDPSINKSEWKSEEDRSLLQLQQKFGNKWSKIKDVMGTNRTENAVKLRFNFLNRQEQKYGESFLKTMKYSNKDVCVTQWTIAQDEVLILIKKYQNRTFIDVLCAEEFKNEEIPKTLRDIVARWEYLCYADNTLEQPFEGVPEGGLRRAAASDALRIGERVTNITPVDLSLNDEEEMSLSKKSSWSTNTYNNFPPVELQPYSYNNSNNGFDYRSRDCDFQEMASLFN